MTTPDALLKFAIAANHERFSHSRARSWRASGAVIDTSDYVVYVYHRDRESPTGVTLAASLFSFEQATKILDAAKKSFPLSPTEGIAIG